MKGKLYMIPNTLGETPAGDVLPEKVIRIVQSLDHFIVENTRNARRFILACGYNKPLEDVKFFELNKHTQPGDAENYLEICRKGGEAGMISEAGVPGVADPGGELAALAHRMGIRVVPLSGPSSILMALMASGMNGQSFTFHGYLPIDKQERTRKIKEIESVSLKSGQTQIFMETPFRNDNLMEILLKTCGGNTILGIACDISSENESIRCMKVSDWKKEKAALNKRPCIFLLNRSLISRSPQ